MSGLEHSKVTNCDAHNTNTSSMLLDEEVGNLKRKLGDHIVVEEDGVKEDSDSRSEQSKKQKRVRSAEVHNLNERLRRQRLKEKIKALQELIPNCSKRDKSSTFDDAIRYIKTLQYQVQVMSMGAGYPPQTMMPHSHPQQQIPNSAPFLTTNPPGIEINYATGTGTGMGTSAMFPSVDFPTNQTGIPDNCLLPSSDTSGMSLNFSCPMASMESHGSKSASSQGPIVSQQPSTRREPTARVLPSKIVQPHPSNEVMDYGSSHSGSYEGSSSSTAKWKNPLFQTVISHLEETDGDEEEEP